MILKQYYLACLSHASYLLADESTRTAFVIDPQRDVDAYAADLERLGLRLRGVLLTHFHADFAAGHLELARRYGASIYMSQRARADFPFEALADGAQLEQGQLRIELLATPGHTPESACWLVYDRERSPTQPQALFSGDTLFIGDVGRPDLLVSAGMSAEQLAAQLYDSLHAKILPLPDAVIVYPAHGAGSACGKNISKDTSAPLGAQKRVNWALQPMSRAEFVRELTREQPAAPAYFAHDADFNRRAHATLDELLPNSLRALTLDELLAAVREGAQLLDTREPRDFAAGHVAGAIDIGLSGKFAHWAGAVLRPERAIALVAEAGKQREAVTRLARIGFDRVLGVWTFDAAELARRPELLRSYARVDGPQLCAELASARPPLVLDVREPGERAAASIPGSLHIPLGELERRAAELPRGRRIAIHCAGGYRSVIAASLLMRAGQRELTDLIGGFPAWQAAAANTGAVS